jgi:hypothetical protein
MQLTILGLDQRFIRISISYKSQIMYGITPLISHRITTPQALWKILDVIRHRGADDKFCSVFGSNNFLMLRFIMLITNAITSTVAAGTSVGSMSSGFIIR